MFFLHTKFNNCETNANYLIEKIDGMPRIVIMSLNLGIMEPVIVITDNKKVSSVLDQYNIENRIVSDNLNGFQKSQNIVIDEKIEDDSIFIAYPEKLLENIDNLDSLSSYVREHKEGNKIEVTTFYTECNAKTENNIMLELNHWGEVINIGQNNNGVMKQIEVYKMNQKTLKTLNLLENSSEFNNLNIDDKIREQYKLTYYSIPLRVYEISNIIEETYIENNIKTKVNN